MELASKKCIPCEVGALPLAREEAERFMTQLKGWQLSTDVKSIEKTFSFKNFASALSFVNAVGEVAEEEGHHPDIDFGWGRARITLTTHAIKGLSENDFVLAAKIDALPS